MFEYQKIDEKHDAVFDILIKISYQVPLLLLHTGLGPPAISSLCSNNFIVLYKTSPPPHNPFILNRVDVIRESLRLVMKWWWVGDVLWLVEFVPSH